MADALDTRIPFKVFGLQRTGTNLMVALLTRNFHVHSLEIGAEWKHGPVVRPLREWNGTLARFVLCVKNPYAWLVSCFRYFREAIGADPTVAPQFVANPSIPFAEFSVTPTYEFESPVHRWNQMYRLWLSTLPADRTFVVRQEDQLTDQTKVLLEAQQKLGLKALGPLAGISRRVDVGATLRAPMNREYYLNREYMAVFPDETLDRVNRLLDHQLMTLFNYDLEQPPAML